MSRRAGESITSVLARGALFGLVGGVAGWILGRAIFNKRTTSALPYAETAQPEALEPSSTGARVKESKVQHAEQQLYAGSAALAFSVLADSGLEHYRGGFYNKAMFIAPTVSALTFAESSRHALNAVKGSELARPVYTTAALTGLIGTGFHIYNIIKREGGFNWLNLFYGAPLAAPVGITFAGLFGLAANYCGEAQAEISGLPLSTLLALGAISGLFGTAAEAGLLHFRGAFQDPFMYLPVTVPPAAAAALGVATFFPGEMSRNIAHLLLKGTALLGFIGMGFHAYGIDRNMGGWRNWSQMILQGPPLPAPPSFTGMALAGLAALALQEEQQ